MSHPAAANSTGRSSLDTLLSAIQHGPSIAAEAQRQAYITLLKRHDWHYDRADDGRAYRAGKAERDTLNVLQREIDPTGAIWNEHCYPDYCIKVTEFTAATDAQPWVMPGVPA